jgi:hypothetical protein
LVVIDPNPAVALLKASPFGRDGPARSVFQFRLVLRSSTIKRSDNWVVYAALDASGRNLGRRLVRLLRVLGQPAIFEFFIHFGSHLSLYRLTPASP